MSLPSESVREHLVTVAVRELVDFALRTGDLGADTDFVGPHRALAGIRGQQKLQRSRPAGYQREVPVQREIIDPPLRLRVQGRIDGLTLEGRHALVEEIKTVTAGWEGDPDPLHWSQVRCYGALLSAQHGLETVELRLTYLNLDTGKVTEFTERADPRDLEACLLSALSIYLEWLRERRTWQQLRDASLARLGFPYQSYRPGQRRLAVAAYRAIARGERLFAEAPTGIGKTVSVLFPAAKALGEGKVERIFYLTARTTGRVVAEECLNLLRSAGARLQGLTLTAKEKICPLSPAGCDASGCAFARGYYDRRRGAMRAALQHETLTRSVIEKVAQEHQVCPFELSLELSSWVDVVVGDYNYVFDPQVYLRRHFGEEQREYVFLIDEAHNLVDRGRAMFSGTIERSAVQEVRARIKEAVPRCARALNKLSQAIRQLRAQDAEEPGGEKAAGELLLELDRSPGREQEKFSPGPVRKGLGGNGVQVQAAFPEEILPLLDEALKQAELWLAKNQPAPFREDLLELYFSLHSFRRRVEVYDERFATVIDGGRWARLRVLCLDPSLLLGQGLARGRSAIFFSATLSPLDYYRDLLGGSATDAFLGLPSPFPPGHLAVLVESRVRTTYQARAASAERVVSGIRTLVRERPGNYMVYFPSYEYLMSVHAIFAALEPGLTILVQEPGMSEARRETFLAAFRVEPGRTLVAFAVLGGVFGEGIDLVGERLIGAVIVGVGLPQLCIERDLVREHFQHRNGAGFEYAYTYPGMNRVLQAAGRVIRSETDRGVLLLMDARYTEKRYRQLFPGWWQPWSVKSDAALRAELKRFWNAGAGNGPERRPLHV